ncbi:MAG: glycosyltransferase [Cryobacterium sp.]|nr:glycosyltransferase [Cryobacterium sp.]
MSTDAGSTRVKVLVLTFTPFAQEPRALKQVRYLKESFSLTTAGFGSSPFPDVPHVQIPEVRTQRWGIVGRLLGAGLLVLHWYRPLRWINALDRVAMKLLGGQNWDVVIAHDLKTIDVALKLSPKHGVVLDLHEYAPRQEEHSALWRWLVAPYFRWMCRTVVPRATEVVTVSQGIVDEYRKQFGIESTLVVNATPYFEGVASKVDAPIKLVHSGGVAPQRRLDIMIEGVRKSKANVILDLYLTGGESTLLSELKMLAGNDQRIRFCEPVAYDRLVATLNNYDVGLSIFPPTTFNLAWCLPNKFFDYVQARLGVIVGPSPEMSRYVKKFGLGIVLPDFEAESLASALEALQLDEVAKWKNSSAAAARELSSEPQAGIWKEVISRILSRDAEIL